MLFKARCAWLCSAQSMASSSKSQDCQNDGLKDGQSKRRWGAWRGLISVHQDMAWKLDNNVLTDKILRRGQVQLPTAIHLLTRRAVLQLRFREAWRGEGVPVPNNIFASRLKRSGGQPTEWEQTATGEAQSWVLSVGDMHQGTWWQQHWDTLCPWLLAGRKMLSSSMLKSC